MRGVIYTGFKPAIRVRRVFATYFGSPSHPSSGVHKTEVETSGTDHTVKYKS